MGFVKKNPFCEIFFDIYACLGRFFGVKGDERWYNWGLRIEACGLRIVD